MEPKWDTCWKMTEVMCRCGKELKRHTCLQWLITVKVYSWIKFISSSVNFLDCNSLIFLLFSVSFHLHQHIDSNAWSKRGLGDTVPELDWELWTGQCTGVVYQWNLRGCLGPCGSPWTEGLKLLCDENLLGNNHLVKQANKQTEQLKRRRTKQKTKFWYIKSEMEPRNLYSWQSFQGILIQLTEGA